MLIIRDDQMEALSAARWKDFEQRAVNYLAKAAPAWCAEVGTPHVRELARIAIVKAKRYQLVEEFDVLRYLNLECVLGEDFDRRLAWAREILERRGLTPRHRMDLLTDQMLSLESAEEAGSALPPQGAALPVE